MLYKFTQILKKYFSKRHPLTKDFYNLDLDMYFENERLLEKLSNMSLESILMLMETDKSSIVHKVYWHPIKKIQYRRIFLTHGYAPYYEKYFSDKRKSVKRIIEIGGMTGSSAAALVMYFPNAILYTLDINYERNNVHSKRIKKINTDQTSISELKLFIKNEKIDKYTIDLIIDDGAHTDKAILTSLKELMPYVSKNGYYVIEDLETKNTPMSIEFLKDTNSEFYKNNIDTVKIFESNQEIDNLDYDTQHYIAFIKPKN